MHILASSLIAQRIYNPQIGGRIANLVGWEFIQRIVTDLVGLVFLIGVVAFLFIIFYGGIRWITASGDKAALESARSTIVNGIIGLIILFIIYVFIQLINLIFGINIADIGLPSVSAPGVPTVTPRPPLVSGTCGAGVVTCDCMCPSGYSPVTACGQSDYPTCSSTCGCATTEPQPDGSPCSNGSMCQSGFCSAFVDNDADGYNQQAVNIPGACVSVALDCNDNDALVHPNQFTYFQTPIAGSANDFNYDCADSDANGDPNDKWPTLNCDNDGTRLACQTTMPTNYESQVGITYGASTPRIPACGENFLQFRFWSCFAYENDSCTMYPGFYNPGCYGGCQGPLSERGNPILTWNIDSAPIWASAYNGYTAMPCK